MIAYLFIITNYAHLIFICKYIASETAYILMLLAHYIQSNYIL